MYHCLIFGSEDNMKIVSTKKINIIRNYLITIQFLLRQMIIPASGLQPVKKADTASADRKAGTTGSTVTVLFSLIRIDNKQSFKASFIRRMFSLFASVLLQDTPGTGPCRRKFLN